MNEALVRNIILDPGVRGRIAFFLGAGCSVTAGIPTTEKIIATIKKELYRLEKNRDAVSDDEINDWLQAVGRLQDPATEYGDALEWFRPSPRLRRLYLESFFKDKEPSAAHRALAGLVHRGTLRTLFTTNFDDLIERACRSLCRIRVVAFEEQINQFSTNEDIPNLFKLHGDFLYDDIRNSAKETAHLPQLQARKLESALRDSGMVVVGYGGADDSVMEVLDRIGPSGFPLGLFWLVLRGSDPPDRVRDLITRTNNMFVTEIDGFDSFISALAAQDFLASGRQSFAVAPVRTVGKFIAHPDGLQLWQKETREVLLSEGVTTVVLTGLPGIGKSSVARELFKEMRGSFSASLAVSAENKSFTLPEFLDECIVQLGLAERHPMTLPTAQQRVLAYLSTTPTLILLDDFGNVDPALFSFLLMVPSTSRVLLTVRVRPPSLASSIERVAERHHPGLSKGELRELFDVLIKRSPELSSKLELLDPRDTDRLIDRINGWPQVLLLFVQRLADPIIEFGEYTQMLSGPNLYQDILSDLVSSLPVFAHKILATASVFSSSFSLAGLRHVLGAKQGRLAAGLRVLADTQLIVKSGPQQYVYAHPAIGEFAQGLLSPVQNRKKRRAAFEFLGSWVHKHGGQPAADWSNFRLLDREFENIRSMLRRLLEEGRLRLLTALFNDLFSYVVERGHWLYTRQLSREVIDVSPAPTLRQDWLIWASWIAFYLESDAEASLGFAMEALQLRRAYARHRFEAHRRAALAGASLGTFPRAAMHLAEAEAICRRRWARSSHQAIDVANTRGQVLYRQAVDAQDPDLFAAAWKSFEEAEALSHGRPNPNTREIGVSLLGKARILLEWERYDEALKQAELATEYATRFSWLRGIGEGNEIVARAAAEVGDISLSVTADSVAKGIFRQLGRFAIL